ncbi:uncharacterized protein E0L32_000180 [Thyridium curvatum]|uniref:Mitochondrial ATPase n=1 Tax=Thyridium curvatum TaxID=1093900 RepID=A0A507B9K1_9PEZI|nr:uncharacterized protein E0L32_000180 [Thyridium curvatum]TPX15846.1 hypothetical protein E0L32_000180 [Thyridium curvatum]
MSIQSLRRGIGTSVTITDPLVRYHALLATGVYSPDPAQHRLARHLQKLYLRLKDYEPPSEYRTRLNELTSAIDRAKDEVTEELAVKSHPIRNNPLFANFFRTTEGPADSLALTRVLTSHQAAVDVDSPKGLFLSGEVGTGKSMLLDLLADGLPTSRKKRWHFNTFMLYAFSKLEQFRKANPQLSQHDAQYSLLWMAKEMVETSPILFLDEFQLPDRAASKLLSHLFIAFFQLGGVLIASSNRMPEELEKATGVHYSPPPGGRIFGHLIAMARRSRGELYGQTSDFAAFLDVLKARCDFWQMEGARDWRRRDENSPLLLSKSKAGPETSAGIGSGGVAGSTTTEPLILEEDVTENEEDEAKRPLKYLTHEDGEQAWHDALTGSLDGAKHTVVPWEPAKLVVYGRYVTIPRQHNGTAYWDFSNLVHSFGPADYVTLASTFHTFIVDQIPVLDMSMKNEARRFITFLDAVYEARCKLILRAAAGPDDLFFPETRTSASKAPAVTNQSGTRFEEDPAEGDDATYSETISEVYQDQMSPFRPNISTYADDSRNAKYDPDQDSDFKLDHGNADGNASASTAAAVNFSNASAFTGEDERFAYKRATSRLWELCSAHWHARGGEDWWRPLPAEARHWEGSAPSVPLADAKIQPVPSDVSFGPSVELEEPAGLERFKLAAMRGGRR